MTTRPAVFLPPRLLCALALACGGALAAHADRVHLPTDGSQQTHYPLSLTEVGDWKALAGTPSAAFGKSSGLRATAAMALPPGTVVEAVIAVPPLPPHEAMWADRFGVVALDLSGAAGPGPAACTLEVLDENGQSLGQAQVSTRQPQIDDAGWSCDSEDVTEPMVRALDGLPGSLWHTDWHHPTPLPHHLQWNAGAPTAIGGFIYTPRQNWRTGMVKDWALQASDDGTAWRQVAAGAFDYPKRDLAPRTVALKQRVSARYFRFVAQSEITGDKNNASAAEFRFLGADGKPLAVAPPANHVPERHARAWVYLTPEFIARVTPPCLEQPRESAPPPQVPADAKKMRLRVTSTGKAPAVVAGIAFTRPPVKSDRKMEVKANAYGPYGPDYFVSGMLGLQGQIDHGEIGVPLLDPLPDSPAARAGLQNGDYLVAVNGAPLNPHFGHQEMGWLVDGHPAAIGRAVVDALRTDAEHPREMGLTVLRGGQLRKVTLHLPTAAPLWRADGPVAEDAMKWQGPAPGSPLWDAMERDLTAKVEKTYQPDNPNTPFATDGVAFVQIPLAGLALLQTKDPRQAERITRCADWCLGQTDLMNQKFWQVGYVGTFLTEYYLATGDRRVRPWIENALAWLPMATHIGNSGEHAQAPGHAPEGLPYNNGGLIAPALHALLFEALAEHAGLRAPAKDFHAQVWNYLDYSYADPARGGDGTVDYSPKARKSDPTAGFSECWTRTGLFNAVEALRGPWPKGAVAGATMNAHSYLMYGSHAYGMPGAAWGVACMADYAPEDYTAVVRRHGWDWIDAWQPGYGMRVSTTLMGQPYMGWENLDNPAWLMALGAHRHALHLCGGVRRNWLDLSGVPDRPGTLRARVDVHGHNVLECWPTGAPVACRRDGRAPTPGGDGPTASDLDRGGVFLAQAFGVNPPPMHPIGAPKWLVVPESKRDWRVLDATGWSDQAECLARAALAIDGKAGTEWLTNAGELRQPFPHRLVVDTGRDRLAAGLRFDRVNLGHFIVSGSSDGKTWTPMREVRWNRRNQADGNHAVALAFDPPPTRVRYLKLDILDTATDDHQPGDPGVFLGEMDVVEPTPEVTVKNGMAELTLPKGFRGVATTDGREPTAESPPVTDGQKIPCPKGAVLRARCLQGDWVGPEILVEGK